MPGRSDDAREASNRAVRMALWLGHGHTSALYGDDGEMQCVACVPPCDYKRDSLAECIVAALASARAAGAAEAFERAAKCSAEFSPPEGYDDCTIGGRAAMKAGDDIAAAIRALAGEERK